MSAWQTAIECFAEQRVGLSVPSASTFIIIFHGWGISMALLSPGAPLPPLSYSSLGHTASFIRLPVFSGGK